MLTSEIVRHPRRLDRVIAGFFHGGEEQAWREGKRGFAVYREFDAVLASYDATHLAVHSALAPVGRDAVGGW
ncbi:MAG: hypothetical protein ABS79_00230 [Planctomycetes bacterium SCN 63-9]|nr:MAG: hypothetical protein ABS79_00230 [Planctomycetes bacterium SCN 63-9]